MLPPFFFFIEDLINPSAPQDQKSINDIPSLLAAAESKKTFPVGPPSDSKYHNVKNIMHYTKRISLVLSRVQAFLPQLKSANEQLKAVDPKKLDIENVDEESEQYIEMVTILERGLIDFNCRH